MTRVTFLHGTRDRLQAAAAWLARAGNASVVVYAPQPEQCTQLDRLLWTQAATGFIPHCRSNDALAAETPILLATSLDGINQDRCLLNLSDEVPQGFSRFEELVEIVSTDETVRSAGRERFRFYRERGYPLENRDISNGLQDTR